MSLILTRSPYFVMVGDRNAETSSLKLEIGNVSGGSFSIDKTYDFAYRSSYAIDVSPFISDYLEDRYAYFGVFGKYVKLNDDDILYVRWTISGGGESDTIQDSYATNGYLYSNDDDKYINNFGTDIYDLNQMLKDRSYLANSTKLMYKLDDAPVRFSLLNVSQELLSSSTSESLNVNYYSKGRLLMSKSIVFDGSDSSSAYQFIESTQYDSFEDRVTEDDGVYEDNKCLGDFLDEYKIEDYDEIRLSSIHGVQAIKIKTIEECKYSPHRVTFVNKLGVLEDLWFFKRSDSSISIGKESYRKNSIGSYIARDGVNTFTDFNVNGREKIVLNSGFVEEEMNEAFRQLLLSENVTLYDYTENKTYNVNLGTSEFQYKQHVNDKLINYTIEFEFAHEVINNVG